MVASELPKLQYTPLDEIPERVDRLRKAFYEHKTRDVEFRLVQLRKLYWAYVAQARQEPVFFIFF